MRKGLKACPICKRENVEQVAEHRTMLYPEYDDERAFHQYKVVQCLDCQHVYLDTGEPDEWLSTLYTKPLEQEVWSLDGAQPYKEVVEFCAKELHEVSTAPNGQVFDIGCGRGSLLKILSETFPFERLLGIDFKNNLTVSLPFLEKDLSQLTRTPTDNEMFSFAFCMHVLEHISDPIEFLARWRVRAKSKARMYIEVPNHDYLAEDTLKASNLWSPQHVNYFNSKSLRRAVILAGWTIEREDTSLFGIVPRVRMILSTTPDRSAVSKTKDAFARIETYYQYGAKLIVDLAARKPVAIWGVGSDFRNMLLHSKELKACLNEGKLRLFDRSLEGQRFQGCLIAHSDELAKIPDAIVITARPANTRSAMKSLATEWNVAGQIVDIWD